MVSVLIINECGKNCFKKEEKKDPLTNPKFLANQDKNLNINFMLPNYSFFLKT